MKQVPTSDPAANEQQVFRELCQERKRDNFEQLKQWDQRRAFKLMTHRRVADQIEDSLHARIAESDEFIQVVRQFYADCQSQQRKYQENEITNPEDQIKSNPMAMFMANSASAQYLSKLFRSSEQARARPQIKKWLTINLEKFDKALSESERELMQLRTQIELKAISIQNENGQTAAKCDKIVSVYKSGSRIFKSSEDLYTLQQEFLSQSLRQMEAQQEYGTLVADFLSKCEHYEKERLELVRQSLQQFLEIMETINSEEQLGSAKSLRDILEKRTQTSIFNSFYSVQQFLDLQIIRDIKTAEQKQESFVIGLPFVKNFLRKLQFRHFSNRNMILKQFRVYLRAEQSLQEAALEDANIIVTIDAFIVIYKLEEQPQLSLDTKPLQCLKCDDSLKLSRVEDTQLIVEVRKWGKKSHRVVFMSQDQREEFVEFVHKLIA